MFGGIVMTKEKTKKKLTEKDLIKLEIAKELGLIDKINTVGFGGLTAKETGRIGGIMTARKKKNELINKTEQ